MKTTLNKIRQHDPCIEGWEKLLKHLGKTKADDEPLSIATILDLNGLAEALGCLRAVEGEDCKIRLYAVWCARQMQHLMKDERSLRALDVAESFAKGQASQEDLDAARAAALDATMAEANAATCASGDASWVAIRAALDAASAAASAAAWAAGDAACAAWGAIRAASASASAAASASASASAWAARDAARAAAWGAARKAQERELRRICEAV